MQHLHKAGDIVAIFQMSHSKGLIIEGKATVLKPVGSAHMEQYMVRFHGRNGKPALGEEYERFIDREGQANPEQYVKDFNKRIGIAA